MNQFFLALFGLSAIWLAMSLDPVHRKWAPLIGLCGQPFWLVHAIDSGGWGILVLTFAYTLVYVRGAWTQWRPA